LGTEKKDTRVSGVYVMLGKEQRLFIGDCTVNVEPDAETLAEIALNTARVAESFGEVPRVAMLSYSDFGEHRSDDRVQVVRRAMKIVRQRRPNLIIDGEMQADTAVNPDKLNAAFPFADLDKAANVLIFPDLTSGNICYKLMGELTAVETVGPLLVGIQAPVNVAPINSSVADIVNVATYTVHQAMSRRRKKKS
jgi:malate dehydrogenase (oxaloacetate-decarboxylating)(NADP+)